MSLLNETQTAQFTRRRELDLSFNWRDQARLRASAFTQRGTIAVALRLIRYELPSFADLGLPEVLAGYVTLPQGLVLVTARPVRASRRPSPPWSTRSTQPGGATS